jgi:hypothetical protein
VGKIMTQRENIKTEFNVPPNVDYEPGEHNRRVCFLAPGDAHTPCRSPLKPQVRFGQTVARCREIDG